MAQRTCTIDGCDKPKYGHGWCSAHYTRWRRNGDPMTTVITPTTEIKNWLRSVLAVTGTECVEWPFNRHPKGYGAATIDGARRRSSHIILEMSGRERPSQDHIALHSCDNPPCCNPTHLRWGTAAENSAEMVERDRSTRGERAHNHMVTEQQVREIRSRYAAGGVFYRELGAEYGISRTEVGLIVNGQRWAHV